MWPLCTLLEHCINYALFTSLDADVCPSSVGVYFTDKCEAVNRVELIKTNKILTSLAYPQVNHSDPEGGQQGCHFQDMFEWMGAVACDIDV